MVLPFEPKPAPFPDVLQRIARGVGTPTYVYFQRTIRQRIEALQHALSQVPSRLLYAMKANTNPAVLDLIRSQGVGIDAVSPAELLLALRLGFRTEDVLFSANNMTDAEMHFAHRQGVLLNIGELSRLEAYGQAYPGSSVCVRLNPQVGAGHHEHVITAGSRSKFGIPVEQSDQILRVAREQGLQITGLHQHIGSGIQDTDTLWKAISVMMETAGRFPGIEFVNLGGGLGIPYRSHDLALDLDHFAERFGGALAAFAAEHGVSVWFEPGRYFTAESGVLLVTATTIKHNAERSFAGVDSGMGHLLRPALYGSYHEIVNLSHPDGPPRVYDIVGNICETGDTFARDRSVSEIRPGDVLAILDAGAYGFAMASEYNLRPLPAEVVVDEGDPLRYHEVTPRQNPGELVAGLLARSSRLTA